MGAGHQKVPSSKKDDAVVCVRECSDACWDPRCLDGELSKNLDNPQPWSVLTLQVRGSCNTARRARHPHQYPWGPCNANMRSEVTHPHAKKLGPNHMAWPRTGAISTSDALPVQPRRSSGGRSVTRTALYTMKVHNRGHSRPRSAALL